ncbi:putative short chain dehydrogenase/ reductase [Xylaria bambusicola]|uniref:putative short chain dehydrogenase/ reductase n=1 Tax=Xylaria bambusicola TaxID=326684 RepID=UPI00200862F7|nr:putative short chain dehydrogenase/ reductase [Xylaria bambusicola]KAI0505432.1 putative short chain dehydrogenase/ reductase [Xylaria bambusicola]
MSAPFHRRLRDKIWPEPLPPSATFKSKTVLVTGATSGLGLAAGVHFASLGARVILTSRDLSRSQSVINHVEHHANAVGEGKVHVMELDMDQYSSCVSFIRRLEHSEICRTGLDVAVLNAGIINVEFTKSSAGWEQTIQVNTLSTTLLGLLLLRWMKHTAKGAKCPPHLVFVTSRDHLDPDITEWPRWHEQGGILEHFSDKGAWPSHMLEPNYAVSKLMLTYAVENICRLAAHLEDQEGDVIVNSVCPGLVSTNLGRSITGTSRLMQVLSCLYLGLMAKSTDYGARFYVTAANTSQEEHGKYIQSLFTDEEYRRLAAPNLTSTEGRRVNEMVWWEIITELKTQLPTLMGWVRNP